jgi:peptidyl-dipeptidase Dcp
MSLNRKKSLTYALTSGAFALLSGLLPLSLQGQDLSPDNPFAQPSELSLYYPPFDAISNEDYEPAFEAGMAQHLVEIDAIVAQDAAPSFENTIVKLELAGQLLNRVSRVFFALSGAHTNDQIQALQQQIAPQLAAHDDAIVLNADLFARIQALFADRAELGLTPEAVRLIEQYHTDFVRAGAALSREEKSRLREINGELASLQTKFSQNVLNEVNAMALVVDSREELTGLDAALIDAAAKEAVSRDLAGKYVIPLLNTSGQPALSSLQNRAVRERLYQVSVARGTRGGEFDNTQTLSSVLKLRAERAQLLGYATHADYVLEDATAQTTQAVNERLAALAPPAAANARREARDLQAMVEASGGDFDLAAWDWQYYSEKLRQERYAFDESQLRPYFELDNVLQRGVFFAAGELYGLRFSERFDLPVYHEDVRVFDVMEEDGSQLGIFIGDFYARPSKRGGAWMNAYVPQSRLLQTQPVVANHLNITKPAEGVATLLSFDEVTTLFHEFGHALHGLFSDVDYPSFSGTRVPRDFVEYPSQVNEMWATWPSVLANYAVHFETGEAMPQELLDKVLAAQKFNQGFATTEYLAASLLDQALHQLTPETVPDAGEIVQFEADALAAAGVDLSEVPPRYRSAYFSHIMGGYSAGYYSYIWSEVLDADSVKWFKENGGLERRNGDHFRATLLSRGGSKEAMSLFRDFRGRDADVTPLLNRRGLN